MKRLVALFFIIASYGIAYSQVSNLVAQRLDSLSGFVPGLNQPIDISVSEVDLKEFLRAIAITNAVNISVEEGIKDRITANFKAEPFKNILLYCVEKYKLDLTYYGNIISIIPQAVKPAKIEELKIASNNGLIDVDINQVPLEKLIKTLSQKTGTNILKAPSAGNPPITLFITGTSLEDLLGSIAQTHNLTYSKNQNGIYVIDGIQTNSATSVSFNPRNLNMTYVFDSLNNPVISIEAYNTPIAAIIKAVNQKLGINYYLYSEPSGNISLQLKNVSYIDLMRFLMQGSSFAFKMENDVFLVGDKANPNTVQTKVVTLKNRRTNIIIESLPAYLKSNVQLHEFAELNSIVLSGNTADIINVEELINSLDQVVPMVLIEVMVIDVSKGRTVSTGITAGFGDSSITSGGQILPGIDFNLSSQSLNQFLDYLNGNGIINLGQVGPNVYLSLKLLEERGDVDVRSTPKLSALNSHEASLKIGETRFYRIETQNVIGAQNPQLITTNQFNQVEANLEIKITPTVSSDNQVTMDVSVEFSNFLGVPSNNAPPDIATRQFKSIVRVKNQEMILLGGLEETEKSQFSSGIPVLSRIPVLKWFFSQRTKTKNESKLVVLIKPTIIN
jgi:type IV pilus assembly protein PilQ